MVEDPTINQAEETGLSAEEQKSPKHWWTSDSVQRATPDESSEQEKASDGSQKDDSNSKSTTSVHSLVDKFKCIGSTVHQKFDNGVHRTSDFFGLYKQVSNDLKDHECKAEVRNRFLDI